MKKICTVLTGILFVALAMAQTPEKMSYQAVVRDANGNLINNQQIGMQVSVLQGSISGTAIYVETQTPSSNANGLVSIEIGTGSIISGSFSSIEWGSSQFFMKVETDLSGGVNYTIVSTSELLSVPYALHSKSAETITGTMWHMNWY